MSRKNRRRRQQEQEAQAAAAANTPVEAPIPTAPTAAEKLISGDMVYRPKGGNNPEDIGANTSLVEFHRVGKGKKTTRVMIDNGTMFPGEGSKYDSMMVDTDPYFQDRETGAFPKEPVDAIVVTHAHEDHIGGIAHDASRGKVLPDIYCTPLTQAFIEQSLIRRKVEQKSWPTFKTIQPGKPVQIGDIHIMPIAASHSVSQSLALAITTPSGSMIHSGDFKADQSLPIGPKFDAKDMRDLGQKALARYGHERFDVATVDSTRAYNPGYTPTEGMVADEIDGIVKDNPSHRIVTAVMGRSTERILNMAKVAAENDRTLVIHGGAILMSLQALARAYEIETGGGPMTAPKGKKSSKPKLDMGSVRSTLNALLKDKYGINGGVKILEGRDQAVDHVPEAKQMVLATGTQGEPLAALPKAARRDEKSLLQLSSNDVVIRSASTIPGNEAAVGAVDAGIQSIGVAKLITTNEALVHSSGHGYAKDMDEYLEAAQARTVIPVHGSVELMEKNAERIATRADELDLSLETMRNGDRVVIGQDVIVTPTNEPVEFLGMRNTVEDPEKSQMGPRIRL
ncbi:MAG: ribonuclease J [Pseudomonadota bacterium]